MPQQVFEEKSRLRREYLKLRGGLTPVDVCKKSKQIGEKVLARPEFTAAQVVMFYYSMRNEVYTPELLRQAQALGKKVCLPIVSTRRGLLVSRVDNIKTDLVPGSFGIMEPKPEESKLIPPNDVDLILVPGVVFDEGGYRLGYGGGYYDRLAAQCFAKQGRPKHYPRPFLIGLAYEFQVLQEIPHQKHDVCLDAIITESRLIFCTSTL